MLSPTPPIDRSNLCPGTGYLIAPRVPHGLATVVEGLAREVLRHRPEDIYVFAAHHFEKLLKLREEYHIKEYSNREFNHEFSRDFNLWPTKETQNIGKLSNGWSLEKEIEIFEKREQTAADAEESQEAFSVSTDRENRKASRQTCSRDPAKKTTKKTSKRSKDNEITDARATRIISQMTALHGSGKNIQTKDIKQELRRNKLSGEKSKAIDSVEKGIRGDRRSRTRIKTDKDSAEEIDRATTTTTTSSSRTSARRPLKKVRRIETESETETEHEVAAKAGLEDGHARSNIKNDGASRKATGSRERRPEARLSEHSSERKVSSRALSMDRIRAYVLRKFASTASLEVLRSPTYVEQVQEVIDRAAPIIKEKLEEIGREKSQGKRSKSVDLAWNKVSLQRHIREEKRHGDEEENERRKSGNGLERKADIMKKEEMEDSLGGDETILTVKREEKKLRRRSVGSGKRSRRRESGDFAVVDQVDDNSKHSNKLEHESDATRDTLEARLTATQSILEGISKSTSELGGVRKNDSVGIEPSKPEISDHMNIVSLPVVRPPSSRNSRSATKNGSDSLTLPPISPEVPKSTKKKDELSLPVLPTAVNGNHSDRKQEQDVSKDVEEASTMHDITSDIEDIAVLSENDHENVDMTQDPGNDCLLLSNVRFINEEECGRDKDIDQVFDETRESLEKFEELEKLEEGRRSEEIFRDSLNVTPEVADVPLRPDSLEPDEDEVKLQNDADSARENTFDRLKDKLIEIEMAERSIEKALASQQVATCDIGEMTNQAEKSVTDGKINEAEEPTNEAEKTVNEIRKSTDAGKISINKDEERKKTNDEEKRKLTNDIKETKYEEISHKTEDLNIEEKLTNKSEKMESEIKRSTNETENSKNKVKIANEIKKSMNENEAEGLKNKAKIKNGVEKIIDQTEITTKARENVIKAQDERPIDKTEKLINEKLSNGIEELAVKIHVENVQPINPRSHKDSQIIEVVEMDGDNTVTSKKETESATNGFFKSTISGNTAITNESSIANENGRTKARKKRESDNLPLTTPFSLELPFSYILSEGSPCEIPDSVTTVIIPDRPYSFPVTINQLESTNQKEESRFDMAKEISKDESQEKDQHECDMEVFGEYIRPEILPVDTDFMCGVKEIKSNQDLAIVHQDLDRIKEEVEEEGKEDEQKEIEKKKNDKEETIKEREMKKIATLQDIVEHEENEETDVRTIGSKNTEEISSSGVLEYESLPDIKDLMVDVVLTNIEGVDVAIESRSLLDISSEENGSTQGTHTTTSSDVKESSVSNQSIESPSPDRPVVPELNLDSLQDNTVSSFKMTANGTEKEDNGSFRESDATTSLVEPLLSDERLMNQPLILADYKEEIVAEELTERNLQSEVPEADQLYHAEHVEYEWLGKDPLSTEINLEDETKSRESSIDSKTLSENGVQVDPLLQEKAETEELGSEEEIARELIGLLDKDLQLCAEELDSKKESIDSGESEKNNLEIDDKFNQPLSTSMHSMSVEQEKREHENFVDKIDKVVKTETISELSSDVTDISQDKSKNSVIIDKETEKIKLEMMEKAHIENSQVAPLAQFEQDELLEENDRSDTTDEKFTVKSKSDIINADHTDIQERFEDKQTSIEEVSGSQSSDSKIEEPNKKREENDSSETPDEKFTVKSKSDIINADHTDIQERFEDKQTSIEEVSESQSSDSKIEEPNKKREENDRSETADEKFTVKSKPDIINADHTDIQERFEDKQTSIEEVSESQNSDSKIEEPNKKREENDRSETADEKFTVKSKPDIINADHTDIQERFEDKQTSIEEVSESQSSDSKIEEPNKKREEIEQEELQNQEKCEQEKLEPHEECKQEKLEIQDKDNQENITIEEKIVSMTALPLEIIELRKDSINESKNDDEHEKTKPNNESIIDDQIEKDTEHEQEEKNEDLSEKTEKVHGPITSAISEQSTENHSRFGYWTTETKSSTVETVIEAFNSNTSTNEKMEIVADAPEIITDESFIRKKDDFHSLSAVVKIQACIRGFLARRRVRRNLNSEFVSNSTPSTQKIVTSDRLVVPQDTLSLREARRLRREEALRNTTLSLENAFATGRLQHTSEFHDSVPLLPFDLTNNKTDSVTSNDSLNEEIDVEEANSPDIAKSSSNESDPVRDREHGTSFHKGNAFVDPTFPIVMHLLTDASRNCHFTVSQNSRSDFNAGGTKPMDILMLGYPRDDENQYLKFITSVEDLNSNMESLTLDDMTKSAKNIDDGHPSTTFGEGSLREPLALPGVSQGVVIEEVTSLDELVPSESTKPSTAPKTSLDTNSSMPSEECALENAKNDLEMSPRTTDGTENLKQGAERQESDRNSESTENSDLRNEDANKKDEISCDDREHVEEEKDDKM